MYPRYTMSYTLAKKLAIQGVRDYLDHKTVEGFGDRDGVFHGDLGKMRAYKILTYLLEINKKEEFIASMIAIFGELYTFLPYVYGRSSRLAGLIADRWFKGTYEIKGILGRPSEITNTLYSDIVDMSILYQSKSKPFTFITRNGLQLSYTEFFHKTNGARDLLDIALDNDFPLAKKDILRLSKTLEKRFNNKTPKWVSNKGISFWAKAATVGALVNTNYYETIENEKKAVLSEEKDVEPTSLEFSKTELSSSKAVSFFPISQKNPPKKEFPLEIAEKVSSFLTLTDSIKLTRVRKKAKASVDTIKKMHPEEFTFRRI